MSRRLLIVDSWDRYFLNNRLAVARAAVHAGFDVAVAAVDTGVARAIAAEGFRFFPLTSGLHGSAAREFRIAFRLRNAYRSFRPDVVHQITVRNIVLGSFMVPRTDAAVINSITGLGYAFANSERGALLRQIMVPVLRTSVGRAHYTILQNNDDWQLLDALKILPRGRSLLIPGSGVELSRFTVNAPACPNLVVFIGRLLYDKGIAEFVQAARITRKLIPNARFAIVGDLDPANRAAVSEQQLAAWISENEVEYWGYRPDIPRVMQDAGVIALPSHREGFPRVVLEAGAAARAVVTTLAPGCRESVIDGVTGYTVPVGDAQALAERIRQLLLDPDLSRAMGLRARAHVESHHDHRVIADRIIAVYDKALHEKHTTSKKGRSAQ